MAHDLLTQDPIEEAFSDINAVTEKLVNGTQLLTIYYIIIFLFFVLDIVIQVRRYRNRRLNKSEDDKKKPLRKGILNFYRSYKKNGILTINAIIYVICLIIIVFNIGLEWNLIINITTSFIVFTVFMKLAIRVFINKNSYEDEATIRGINVICYILLGNYFCYYMSFISTPDLLISLSGSTLALFLCYYIMLHAIFNPQILQKSNSNNIIYSQAFGIIKGMVAILVLLLATLFMMIYCCFRASPNFFTIEAGEALDVWDLIYFLIISFTTIGYGDIIPVRYQGMFYSKYAAIMIGVSSIFTTTCFVAAVISTANSLAKSTRDKYKAIEEGTSNSSLFSINGTITEAKIHQLIEETIETYNKIKTKDVVSALNKSNVSKSSNSNVSPDETKVDTKEEEEKTPLDKAIKEITQKVKEVADPDLVSPDQIEKNNKDEDLDKDQSKSKEENT